MLIAIAAVDASRCLGFYSQKNSWIDSRFGDFIGAFDSFLDRLRTPQDLNATMVSWEGFSMMIFKTFPTKRCQVKRFGKVRVIPLFGLIGLMIAMRWGYY